ncbi:MAG: DUF45 domain-containing protein [bacterium]|nr:DUF45 domain-containing protein [bacterium]
MVIKKVRYHRIMIKNRKVFLVTPKKLRDPDRLIEQRRDWILAKLGQMEKVEQEAGKMIDVPLLRKEFGERMQDRDGVKKELKQRISGLAGLYADRLDVEYNRISIKDQRSKWGSASMKGNLNFNIRLAFVHEDVLRMIVFHEVLHLRIMRHNREFKSYLKQEFVNYKELCRMLRYYSYLLM